MLLQVCKMSGEEKMPAFSKVSPQASTDNAQPVCCQLCSSARSVVAQAPS